MTEKMWKAAKARNPAEIYNEKRRIIFVQMLKDPAVAKTWGCASRAQIVVGFSAAGS